MRNTTKFGSLKTELYFRRYDFYKISQFPAKRKNENHIRQKLCIGSPEVFGNQISPKLKTPLS
jgi:hypothetical protein